MAFLIVGGTGFVGSRLIKRFLEEGEKVVCFDLFPNREAIAEVEDQVSLEIGDITRIEDLLSVIKKHRIHKIINLAYLLGPESEANLHLAVRVNILGMNNVFEASLLMEVERVVYASSIAVYGLQASHGERAVTEEDPCCPTLVYGAHKVVNEFMAERYTKHHGVDIVGLRMAIVAGPGRKTGLSAWASGFVDLPANGQPMRFPFRSDQKTILIYVDQAVEIFSLLSQTKTHRYQIYNSGGYETTMGELARKVKSFLPRADFSFDEKAPEQPLIYHWDSRRIETEFGLKRQSLDDLIQNHIKEVQQKEGNR